MSYEKTIDRTVKKKFYKIIHCNKSNINRAVENLLLLFFLLILSQINHFISWITENIDYY